MESKFFFKFHRFNLLSFCFKMLKIRLQVIFLYIISMFFFSFKVAPHESPLSSQPSSEDQGESTPEENAEGHIDGATTTEAPVSLADLLG